MFKVNNKKTPERCFSVFIVNFKHVSRLFTSASIVNFEQVNVSRIIYYFNSIFKYGIANRVLTSKILSKYCRILDQYFIC